MAFNPVALYELAKRRNPEGLSGKNFLSVEVEGTPLELRFFTDRGNGSDVEFRFFREDARYARRTVIVWSDGRMESDGKGVIPEFDKREGEKPITLSMEALMRIAYDALLASA